MLNHTLEELEEEKDTTLLTFADGEWEGNQSGFQDISAIPIDREYIIGRSLEDNELSATINEIKEEEDEESSEGEEYCQKDSNPLQIESLTNESTWHKSNVNFRCNFYLAVVCAEIIRIFQVKILIQI